MRESEVHMPKELEKTCHELILVYEAATLEVVAPRQVSREMPISYTIPIDELQLHIGMVAGLGRVFGFTLSDTVAKVIVNVCIGQATAIGMIKWPIATIVEHPEMREAKRIWCAAARTKELGWLVAEDFYRMSNGEEPVNITEIAGDLGTIIGELRSSKTE